MSKLMFAGRYDGDLTITVYPNLNIRVPNHQLVIPEYDFNSYGQRYIKNSTNRQTLLYSYQDINKNDMPVYGKPFLTSAYLFVNSDRGEFTLWASQPNTTQNIVAVGPPVCSSTPSSQPALPAPTSLATSGAKEKAPTGAIAGAVVGGLAGTALIIGALLFLARRRRNKRRQQEAQDAPPRDSSLAGSGQRSSRWGEKAEMSTDTHPPLEMPSTRDPGYATPPYEMPGRKDARYVMVPHEMPDGKDYTQGGAAHEMPATPMSGRPF